MFLERLGDDNKVGEMGVDIRLESEHLVYEPLERGGRVREPIRHPPELV